MIYILNVNDSDAAALGRICSERNIKPTAMLSAIAHEGCRLLVEERRMSLDNILNPVGLAADLIRSTMSEDEFVAFCESDTSIDDMEDNFKNNCIELVVLNEDPAAVLARKFIASLFLGNADLSLLERFDDLLPKARKSTDVPLYIEDLVRVLKENDGKPMKFKEITEQCEGIPPQAAAVFSKMVTSGGVANVSVEKDSNKTNVYTYRS